VIWAAKKMDTGKRWILEMKKNIINSQIEFEIKQNLLFRNLKSNQNLLLQQISIKKKPCNKNFTLFLNVILQLKTKIKFIFQRKIQLK